MAVDQELSALASVASLLSTDIIYLVRDPGGVAEADHKVPVSVLDTRYPGAVTSVFGRTGAVVATSGDYSAAQITGLGTLAVLNSPLPIVNGGSGQVTQQAAINALTDVAGADDNDVLTKDTITGNAIFKPVAAVIVAAPIAATYIVQTPDGTLTNEQALSALATGLLKNTTTTGVLSIGVAGTDYAGLAFANVFTAAQKINVNSTAALFVEQDSVHDNVLLVDTTNGRVGFGITPSAQVDIKTDATNKIPLIVRSIASATVDAMVLYDLDGNIGFQFDRFSKFIINGGVKIQSAIGDGDYVLQTTNDVNGDVLIKNRPGFPTHSGLQVRCDSNLISAVRNVLILDHANLSDAPTAGFGNGIIFLARSSTTEKQSMGRLTYEWATATHASRAATGKLTAYYITTERTALQWTADSSAVTLETGGFVGVGIAPLVPLHILGANGEIRAQNVITDATNKSGRITIGHYTNAEEPFQIVGGIASSVQNSLQFGGGASSINAATIHQFYAAANSTTTTGTVVMRMTLAGLRIEPAGASVAAAASLHVVQALTTAAVPVLRLNQADLSEEFIRFESTVGAGNPIDTAALGAYYGKVRVYVEGVGAKWLALYD